jgi:anti-sigma B factor antagonist
MPSSTDSGTALAGATFFCNVQPDRDAAIVAPVGELDMATVPLLDAELCTLRDAGFRKLVVDLRGLSFIDSSGVQLLIRWATRAVRHGQAFSLVPGSERVQMVLALTGVVDLLAFDQP